MIARPSLRRAILPIPHLAMPHNNHVSHRPTLIQRIRYSVFPGTITRRKDRQGYRPLFNSLVLHFRPRSVPERTLRFTLTWGLGGMAVVLICTLFATGLMLKFVYQPVPDRAYESVIHLQNEVPFGQLTRNIHHWSANILIIVVFLHFLRTFFSGAFQTPRQFNWIIGLGLFAAVLLSNLTGYLLPWDQLAFWAITICTGMLEYVPGVGVWLQNLINGGSEVGPETLSNFYAVHTAILPAALLTLMPFHFWRIRKAGGLVIPRTPEEDAASIRDPVPSIPNLILRELVVALILIAFVLAFSVAFDAPLDTKANPGLSPNPTKAPWYFVGLQEILLHFHPLFALLIIPAVMLLGLLSIPYVDYRFNTAGVWFASSKGRRMALVTVMAATVLTPLGILTDEYVVHFAGWLPGTPPVLSNGLLPAIVCLAVLIAFYGLMKKRYAASNNELIQSVFILFVVAFIVLTITGVWFRGEEMGLKWPWR
jgi:quinol-cytochrome oxidoreductase complex cytochrome b subunit